MGNLFFYAVYLAHHALFQKQVVAEALRGLTKKGQLAPIILANWEGMTHTTWRLWN